MSLILIAFCTGGGIERTPVPNAMHAFPVKAQLVGEGDELVAIALTDGVASDRFFRFTNDSLGRDGDRLRRALLSFLTAARNPNGYLMIKPVQAKGQVKRVAFDPANAMRFPLDKLDDALKALSPGKSVLFT
ncbi:MULTISPECIES: hypothetical protein [unclassified Variovorax]|uniref:hypothetical protein n=1 Tax=unclassified Variovorax TaxID=663243 RepID=UPI003ECDF5B1